MAQTLRENSGEATGERRALIAGPNRFQNLLLAAYIETHGDCKSALCGPLEAAAAGREEGTTAVLHDCFGMSSAAIEQALLSHLEQLPREWYTVLFNIERGCGVESCALASGVHGFFYGDDTLETVLKGLAAVFRGELWVSRRKMEDVIIGSGFRLRHLRVTSPPHNLTRREMEVLGLLTLGSSNAGIARRLFISPHTVRTHMYRIFRKINVGSRLEASLWASEALFQHASD